MQYTIYNKKSIFISKPWVRPTEQIWTTLSRVVTLTIIGILSLITTINIDNNRHTQFNNNYHRIHMEILCFASSHFFMFHRRIFKSPKALPMTAVSSWTTYSVESRSFTFSRCHRLATGAAKYWQWRILLNETTFHWAVRNLYTTFIVLNCYIDLNASLDKWRCSFKYVTTLFVGICFFHNSVMLITDLTSGYTLQSRKN